MSCKQSGALLFAAFFFSAPAFCQPIAETTRTPSLTQEEVDKLPVWLELSVAGKKKNRVDLGATFFGDRKAGVLRIRNDLTATVELSKIRTSCGCVSAARAVDQIRPGESELVVLDVKASTAGRFAATAVITLNQDQYTVDIVANVRHHMTPTKTSVGFNAERRATIDIAVNNPDLTLDLANTKLVGLPDEITAELKDARDDRLRFEIKIDESIVSKTIQFMVSSQDFLSPVMQVRLIESNTIRLRPASFSIDDGDDKIRFFLLGDTGPFFSEIDSNPKGRFDAELSLATKSGDELVFPVSGTAIRLGTSGRGEISIPGNDIPKGEYVAAVAGNNFRFSFVLMRIK